MYRIKNSVIRYDDPAMKDLIARFRNFRPADVVGQKKPALDLPLVSWDILQQANVSYIKGPELIEVTKSTASYYDQVIFSARPSYLSTYASACFSYIFHSRDPMLAAALHITSSHVKEPAFHVGLVRQTLDNLQKLAPDARFYAFISGGYAFDSPEYPEKLKLSAKFSNRQIMTSVLWTMLERGVIVRNIDIGGDTIKQEIDISTGEYKLTFAPHKRTVCYEQD